MNYTKEMLRKVQLRQLEILKEVDRICKKYNIRYTLSGGTLLGAVRHKGFIPWDDDLDIDMMRPDYEKFLKICETDLLDQYFVQNYHTDRYCLNVSFTKIRENGTIFESEGQRHLKRHKGIGIDIFPIDIVPESSVERYRQKKRIALLQKMVALKLKFNYYNDRWPKKITKIVGSLLLTPVSIKKIGRIMESTKRKYENSDSPFVANTYSELFYEKLTFHKDIYGEPVYLDFEGFQFPAPEQWDEYLASLYGDYMTPPPLDKRWNYQHNIVKVLI